MDSVELASGDNNQSLPTSPRRIEEPFRDEKSNDDPIKRTTDVHNVFNVEEITPQVIEDNEIKLKERMAQCKNIIESLKQELNEEKSKLERESKSSPICDSQDVTPRPPAAGYPDTTGFMQGLTSPSDMYSASVETKLACDENLIAYEKQLQKYQHTLNMAQTEKKNAIRKQMLTKAYKLKLLEVENQCNIELLRVKQSLQCLESLQLVANKWKATTDEPDLDNFELIRRYPEIGETSGTDEKSLRDDIENRIVPEQPGTNNRDDSAANECFLGLLL